RELAARFAASQAFQVVLSPSGRRVAIQALHAGTVWAVLVIPYDFRCQVSQEQAAVQWLLDGVDANSARLLRNYAQAIVEQYGQELGYRPPLRIQDRVRYNETRDSRLAIIPGVIAIVMAVVGAMMTALTIAREVELGNLVMLRTTPLNRREFLLGKLLPYFCIGMVELIVALAAAVWLFAMPLRGSLPWLILLSALFLGVVMLQGALLSSLAGSQLLASQMALLSTFLPAFLLSGFIFAIDNMPIVLRYLTLLVPARYYVTLSRVIFLKGVTPLVLWAEVLALLLMLLILYRLTLTQVEKLGLLP
ncbi:MAG TPA: ABC transporter permease, partial [Candidatus Competibacteraceae bacterium]|nr:ABC transporter permease [Candidatus Competibacteraceae bacterium]